MLTLTIAIGSILAAMILGVSIYFCRMRASTRRIKRKVVKKGPKREAEQFSLVPSAANNSTQQVVQVSPEKFSSMPPQVSDSVHSSVNGEFAGSIMTLVAINKMKRDGESADAESPGVTRT